MSQYKAFIFDMDGTMVNNMHYHEDAWYDLVVNQLKAGLTQQQLKSQLYGKNDEVFERIFGAGKFTKEEMDELAMQKEIAYQKAYLPELKLIKGLKTLLAKAKAEDIKMAIGTAAIPFNVDYVLDNLKLRQYFPVIITAHDVSVSKPNPDVFLVAAQKLGVRPEECIVFEDAPKGIEAARRAGMKAVGITSYHSAGELEGDNVLCVVDDYTDKALDVIWE